MGVVGGVGNGAGAALSPLLVATLLVRYGWRGSFLGIAAVTVLVGFPILYLLLRDPPGFYNVAATGPTSTGDMTLRQARSTSTFWIILAAIAVGAGCMTAVFAHVVPLLLDRGFSEQRATVVLATFATVTAAWVVRGGGPLGAPPPPLGPTRASLV